VNQSQTQKRRHGAEEMQFIDDAMTEKTMMVLLDCLSRPYTVSLDLEVIIEGLGTSTINALYHHAV
jgi:hypothetical protein